MVKDTSNTNPDTAVLSLTGIDGEIDNLYKLDRYLGDVLTLPYTFDQIKIETNELCVADNINASITKLHQMWEY